MGGGQRGFNRNVGRDADHAGIVGEQQRLGVGGTMDPRSCGAGSRLKPSMTTRSTCAIFANSSGSRGSPAPRNSCIRAQRRVEDTSTSVAPDSRCRQESFAGNVDIEFVMGVLDDGNAAAILQQMRDHPRQQGGLAGAAPSARPITFIFLILTVIASGAKQSMASPGREMDCFAPLAMTAVAAFRPYPEMVYIGWRPLSC